MLDFGEITLVITVSDYEMLHVFFKWKIGQGQRFFRAMSRKMLLLNVSFVNIFVDVTWKKRSL